jgi:cation diffusion facilitator family transporter
VNHIALAGERSRAVPRVLLRVLLANLVVVAAKAAVGFTTGSLAVLGDALHASVDAFNNLFGLAVIRVASKGPDADHPYGHAKAETLGAIGIIVFLSLTLSQLLDHSISRLREGAAAPEPTPAALGLLGFTLLVNVAIVRYEGRQARQLGSELLAADAQHTRADVFITLAVIGGLVLADRGLPWADPVLALVVAALIVRIAAQILRRALPTLMDEVAVDAAALSRAALAVPGVRAAYAIRSRRAGALDFAELTISVDGAATVTSGHAIADAVESDLRQRFGLHEVVVHVEPSA